MTFVNGITSPTPWPMLVAMEKGLFAKYGLDFKMIQISGGPATVQAVLGGSGDMGQAGGPDLMTAFAGGARLKVLATLNTESSDSLLAKPSIDSPQKLKGGKIAVSQLGSTSHLTAWLMVESLGLNPDQDVSYVQIGNDAARAAALEAGSVDATPMNPTVGFKLEQELGFKALIGASKALSFPSANLVTSPSYYAQQPETLKAFMRGLLDAIDWLYVPANKREAKEILATRLLKVSPDDPSMEVAYEQYIVGRKFADPPRVPVDGFKKIRDFSVKFNDQMANVKLEEVLDDSLLLSVSAERKR